MVCCPMSLCEATYRRKLQRITNIYTNWKLSCFNVILESNCLICLALPDKVKVVHSNEEVSLYAVSRLVAASCLMRLHRHWDSGRIAAALMWTGCCKGWNPAVSRRLQQSTWPGQCQKAAQWPAPGSQHPSWRHLDPPWQGFFCDWSGQRR